ncbi:MAG TPA: hypothetical protein VEU30_05020, partial [Thermoanaerobaculia bacterium]|nr:hypothetical protein [Thermoanaerobaculia bacterium]
HGVVKEEELKEVATLPIEAAADEYLRRALARGAPDNVTVIVATIEAAGDDDEDTAPLPDALEETQPLMALDAAAFDETLKDTQPLPPAPPELADAAAPAPAAPAPRKGRSLLWMLVVIVLAAAGAWFYYWNH